jgi:hypothetical protein
LARLQLVRHRPSLGHRVRVAVHGRDSLGIKLDRRTSQKVDLDVVANALAADPVLGSS